MLKHCLLALTLAALVCMVMPAALAQDTGNNDQQTAPSGATSGIGSGHGHMDPAKRVAMLAKQLNLSKDQQSKVQDILKAQQSQMESLRADSSVSHEDRRSKMMELHKSTNDQIRGLLDPDQQKKWDEMQSRREERMQGHRHGDQAPGPPDSSPPQQ